MPHSPSAPFKLRSLPVIDIAPWVAPVSARVRGHNGGRRSTAAALHAACLTYGFFYLDISSYVEKQEMEELSELARCVLERIRVTALVLTSLFVDLLVVKTVLCPTSRRKR